MNQIKFNTFITEVNALIENNTKLTTIHDELQNEIIKLKDIIVGHEQTINLKQNKIEELNERINKIV